MTLDIVLFSGLAADATIFAPQKRAFPNLVVPAWPLPLPDDTLDSYCDRLAESLPCRGKVIVGGASFGGIVALHVARRIEATAVVLIGSVRSPSELPLALKMVRPLKALVHVTPIRLLQFCSFPLLFKCFSSHLGEIIRQFSRADPYTLKWSITQLLAWSTVPTPQCPIFHVHGDRDFVLPIQYVNPDTVVVGAGHVMSLTHPTEVNSFIADVMKKVA